VKHKTSELSGALLDVAVALAEGYTPGKFGSKNFFLEHVGRRVTASNTFPADLVCLVEPHPGVDTYYIGVESGADSGAWLYDPSTSWAQGGPIIERELICLQGKVGGWEATINGENAARVYPPLGDGPTPLVAAMRAFVASKLGEEVELP
jgi:hypothetical protein